MEVDVLKNFIQAKLACDYVKVNGDGRHFNAIIVSNLFQDLNTLKRQQKVYEFLGEKIQSGELHALTMKTYTPIEWHQLEEKKNG